MFNSSAILCNSETDFCLSSVMSTLGDSMVPTTFLSRMDAASTALGGGARGVVPAGFGKGFLYEVMVSNI